MVCKALFSVLLRNFCIIITRPPNMGHRVHTIVNSLLHDFSSQADLVVDFRRITVVCSSPIINHDAVLHPHL
jgi:hypothetical protein